MKTKKRIALFLVLCLSLSCLFVGCKTNEREGNASEETVTIAGLKGPTSIGMIQLIDTAALDGETLDGSLCHVNYMIADAPDAVMGKFLNDEIQIAALATNVGSVLYNKTKGNVVILAEDTLGILYLVGREPITSIDQLKGKTVAISGSGNVPQYAADYILAQNGLADSVTLNYLSDHASTAQMLLAGDVDLAILPQPFATQVIKKDSTISVLLNLTDEWEKASKNKSTLSMGCLVAKKDFVESHPELIQAFLTEFEKSVSFVNGSTAEAAQLVEKHGILDNAELAEAAIPYCNIVFKPATEAKSEISAFLNVLYEFEPSSVGGALPDDSFYYTEK